MPAVAMREFRAALQTGARRQGRGALRPRRKLPARRTVKADAKKEALAALEIAPSFERAQELLLNAVSRGSR